MSPKRPAMPGRVALRLRNSARERPTRRGRIARLSTGSVMLAEALVVLGSLGCADSQPTSPSLPSLPSLGSYGLTVTEPSDLAIDETGTILWTVTNDPDSVYQLTTTGTRVKTLKYSGQDLEGVAYDPATQTLWVAEENQRSLVQLDLDGNVLARHDLSLTGEPNSGLEGICLDAGGAMFLLNEKLPGMFIPLNPDVSIASKDTLTFAGDYSGICYEPGSTNFWIVSDQSHRLYLWSKTTGVTKEYDLPFLKAEGVAFDPATNRVYVVSDSENRLYVYQYTP